jgi:hypothetical protein
MITRSVSEAAVTDDGLPFLANFPHLNVLNLDSTSDTDAGLQTMERHTSLSELVIRKTNVTASGVRRLQGSLPKYRIGSDY